MYTIPKRFVVDAVPNPEIPFDKPTAILTILGDVSHISKCVAIVTEKAKTISHRSDPIALKNYIGLAKNIGPLRSWANYVRDMTIEELEASEYEADVMNNMKENLNETVRHIEAADAILNPWRKMPSWKPRSQLPTTHRMRDLVGESLFKLDVANRPIRTLHAVCVKTLGLMVELDAKTTLDGETETWGNYRDQEKRLREWGPDRVDGQAPIDSYLAIATTEGIEEDARLLFGAFSIILFIEYEYLRDRIAAHAASETSSQQQLPQFKLEECQVLHDRIYYILNTDFRFISGLRHQENTMLAELSRGSDLEDEFAIKPGPLDSINIALNILQMLAEVITPIAVHISHDPLEWLKGHLWEESVAQVNKMSEGSYRVVQKKFILTDALEYFETHPTELEHEAANEAESQ